MNTSKLSTILVAASLALPAAAFSQATSNPGQSGQQREQSGVPRSQGVGTAAATTGQIQRVSEDHLKDRMTAEKIVGKTVVDSQGQKIGKIKAVSLSQVIGMHGKKDRATTGAGSASSPTHAAGARASGGMMGGQEVHVYITADNALDLGDDLLVVPASQLTANADNDEFRLQISRDALRSVSQVSSNLR